MAAVWHGPCWHSYPIFDHARAGDQYPIFVIRRINCHHDHDTHIQYIQFAQHMRAVRERSYDDWELLVRNRMITAINRSRSPEPENVQNRGNYRERTPPPEWHETF